MYQEKFVVKDSDVDSNQEIKISRLLWYMQEVATRDAERLKISRDELMKNGNFWVVARNDIKIHRLPTLGEHFVISTHPGETRGFMFPRFCEVYDKHHHLLVTVAGIWLVLNYQTRKIVIHPFSITTPGETSIDDLPLPAKINEPASNLLGVRKTKESELDVNVHINNTYYFDYVLDVHDSDFYKENRVSRLLINYEKEITHPSDISLYSSNSNPEIIIGKVGDAVSFAAKVEFTKR